jgi:hypothetical protein
MLAVQAAAIASVESPPFSQASASTSSNEVPEIKTGLFIRSDDKYKIKLTQGSSAFLPQTMLGVLIVLNQTPFRDRTNIMSTICLTSRSLREHFQNGARAGDLRIIPEAGKYELGDVILLFDEIILRREEDYTQTALWRIIPKDGQKLSEAELLILEKKLGLREKIPMMESYAAPLTANTLSPERAVTKAIETKLEDPQTTNRKEFLIPNTNVTLYIRNHQGNRIWVALPKDKKRLSFQERKAIETYLGLKIRYKKVSENDIICFGPGQEKYFRKRNPSLSNKDSSNKFPNLDKYQGDVFIPRGRMWEPLIFEIKTNEKKERVWTTHKDQYEMAEKYVDRKRCGCDHMTEMPSTAVILTGKGAERFWKGAGTTEFDQRIARDFIDPYNLDSEHIIFTNEYGKCPVFLGENNGEYFLWVYRAHYSDIAEIIDLCPTDPNLERITRSDWDRLDLLRRKAVRDQRTDDGTEEFAKQRRLPSRGDRVF